jgi:hypothetical protein
VDVLFGHVVEVVFFGCLMVGLLFFAATVYLSHPLD